MEAETDEIQTQNETPDRNEFKKPVLIGKIGKLLKKYRNEPKASEEKEPDPKVHKEPSKEEPSKSSLTPAVPTNEPPHTYKEPKWSGLCPDGSDYALEVLKTGMILDKIELMAKPYYIFGRLPNCDVVMIHPTISRYHCCIQYKAFAEEGEPACGWYLYDMGSTHGTFLNKEKLKPNHYTRVRVGHQIRFGNSTRTYIMMGPDFDCEGESELSVTEIKQRALNMKLKRDEMIRLEKERRAMEMLEEEKRREEQGIDWGMGEDAEEEPDLSENPYAVTANEELYLDDPKKTLRGYYEREGHELSYDCEERGVGQFLCRVELPIDDSRGKPVVAEVLHKGKKKEAVVACALEACRILDRAGLLRQAKHESRKKKQRDWSADDYYDSDEDTFLDRTGNVERKRMQRMAKHGAVEAKVDKALTYDDLLKKIKDLEDQVSSEEKCLERLRASNKPEDQSQDEDALDAFMSSLGKQGQTMAQKAEISKTKMSIQKLKAELAKTHRLADLARPAHLPPLVKKTESKMGVKLGSNSVVYGKRLRLKEENDWKPKIKREAKKEEEEFVEEMDSDEEDTTNNDVKEDKPIEVKEHKIVIDKEETKDDKLKEVHSDVSIKKKDAKVYGPMRPPEDYVIPENYFDQETERDLPEINEEECT